MSIKLFQNILAYRMTESLVIHGEPANALNELLLEHPARMPGSQELNTIGFIPPCLEEGHFIERVSGSRDSYVLAVMSYERLLPGKVVRTEVSRRVRKIEEAESRKVYAREKQRLKDDVIQDFLPRAFIDSKITYVLISGPYIYIDTSSAKRGEDVLHSLRDALGSLPVRPVTVNGTPIDIFTRWLIEGDQEAFALTGDFKANGLSDESDLLTGKGVDLDDEELHDALRASGRRVTQLGLGWVEPVGEYTITFTLNEMLGMKGIKWDRAMADTVTADVGDSDDEGDARLVTELRATFLLLNNTIGTMWRTLLHELGGEDAPEEETLIERTFREAGVKGAVVTQADDEEDLV